MSFCGFVSYSTSDGAAEAERALRTWVARTAAVRDDAEWRSSTSRGWMSAFSPVAGPAHAAQLQRDHGGLLVGDVPLTWLTATDADERAALPRAPVADLVHRLPPAEFAFALWRDDESQLTLYRDLFGARALLYVHQPGRWLAFASLPEPLLTIPGVRSQLDAPTLAGQLINDGNRRQARDATLFARLRRVPPAHVLRCSATSFSVEEYWRLRVAAPLDTDPDDPEVPKALLGHLETAVRRRVAGIRQVGAQVSGGLDSSGVTAIAHATRDPESSMFAYTIRRHDWHRQLLNPEEQQLATLLEEELPGVVRRVVNQHRAKRPYFLYQRRYLERPLPDMVFFLNSHDRLLEAARQDGCGVMLTGWGGDEMVSSRTHLHVLAMLTEGRWRQALRNLLAPAGGGNPLRSVWSYVARPLLGAVPRARWGTDTNEQIRRIFANKPLASLVAPARWTTSRVSVRRHRLDALYRPGNSLMLEVQDWLGQRAGIAGVHPLFDRDLVSFANRLPAEWIADRQVRRRAFRTALIPVLSDAHRLREKMRRPGHVSRVPPGGRAVLLTQRALDDLAQSGTWLHEYVNLAALAEASRVRREPDRGDPIAQIGAGVLVVARAVLS